MVLKEARASCFPGRSLGPEIPAQAGVGGLSVGIKSKSLEKWGSFAPAFCLSLGSPGWTSVCPSTCVETAEVSEWGRHAQCVAPLSWDWGRPSLEKGASSPSPTRRQLQWGDLCLFPSHRYLHDWLWSLFKHIPCILRWHIAFTLRQVAVHPRWALGPKDRWLLEEGNKLTVFSGSLGWTSVSSPSCSPLPSAHFTQEKLDSLRD